MLNAVHILLCRKFLDTTETKQGIEPWTRYLMVTENYNQLNYSNEQTTCGFSQNTLLYAERQTTTFDYHSS